MSFDLLSTRHAGRAAGVALLAFLVAAFAGFPAAAADDDGPPPPEAVETDPAEATDDEAEPEEAEPAPVKAPRSTIPEVLVTAPSRFPESAKRVTTDYEVIDQDALERVQSVSVGDALMEVPGVHVQWAGSAGRSTLTFLRGSAGNQTVVLLDGMPLNAGGSGFDFANLGSSAIERVEVIRGSYGLFYGSEAIGGVISLESRRGRGKPGGFVLLEAGSFGTHREVLGIGGSDDRLDFAATICNLGQDGNLDHNKYRSFELLTRFGYEITPRVRFDVTYSMGTRQIQIAYRAGPQGGRPFTEENADYGVDRNTIGGNLTVTAADWLTLRFHGSWQEVQMWQFNPADGPTTYDPDGIPDSGDEFQAEEPLLDYDLTIRDLRGRGSATVYLNELVGWGYVEDGSPEVEFNFGGEYLSENYRLDQRTPRVMVTTGPEQNRFLLDASRRIRSVYAAAEIALPDWGELTGGVVDGGIRYDKFSQYESVTTRFLGARVTIASTGTILRGAFGEGFQAPNPNYLHNPNYGNPELEAQISDSYDVGIHQPLFDGMLHFSVTRFWMYIDNNVLWRDGKLQNLGAGSEGRGWELAMRARLGGGFAIRGSWTEQRLEDAGTGDLFGRPRFASGGISWSDDRLSVALNYTFSAALTDIPGWYSGPNAEARDRIGRRHLVDLTARYVLSDTVTLHGRIENLLNYEYVVNPGNPAGLPFGIYLGARVNF